MQVSSELHTDRCSEASLQLATVIMPYICMQTDITDLNADDCCQAGPACCNSIGMPCDCMLTFIIAAVYSLVEKENVEQAEAKLAAYESSNLENIVQNAARKVC